MSTYLNDRDRFQCGNQEYRSGDVVVVWEGGQWFETRIEHDGQGYYSIDGLSLLGKEVRHFRDDGDYNL